MLSYPFPFVTQPQHVDKVDASSSEYHNSLRSKNIPITSKDHLHRTASELQLRADEQIAEQRDYIFFSRVVNGIHQSMVEGQPKGKLQAEGQLCLRRVLDARQMPTGFTICSTALLTPTSPAMSGYESDIGLPLEDDDSLIYAPLLADLHAIASEAMAISHHADDPGMIFELDL